jgi:hypothetical protein
LPLHGTNVPVKKSRTELLYGQVILLPPRRDIFDRCWAVAIDAVVGIGAVGVILLWPYEVSFPRLNRSGASRIDAFALASLPRYRLVAFLLRIASRNHVRIVDNSLHFVKDFSRFVLKGLATHVYNSQMIMRVDVDGKRTEIHSQGYEALFGFFQMLRFRYGCFCGGESALQ